MMWLCLASFLIKWEMCNLNPLNVQRLHCTESPAALEFWELSSDCCVATPADIFVTILKKKLFPAQPARTKILSKGLTKKNTNISRGRFQLNGLTLPPPPEYVTFVCAEEKGKSPEQKGVVLVLDLLLSQSEWAGIQQQGGAGRSRDRKLTEFFSIYNSITC